MRSAALPFILYRNNIMLERATDVGCPPFLFAEPVLVKVFCAVLAKSGCNVRGLIKNEAARIWIGFLLLA